MKKLLLAIAALIILLVGLVVIRTFTYPFAVHQLTDDNGSWSGQLSDKAVQRLVGGIRIPTISNEVYEQTDFAPFDRFKEYLAEVYPRNYAVMDTLTVNKYGLVFRWPGKDAQAAPLLFIAHYDVVPVVGYSPQESGGDTVIYRLHDNALPAVTQTQTEWTYPPFSGAVADGRIHGRGTLDDKGVLFSLMEAADSLIAEGFVPSQDIWFAFGHDEECSGEQGAGKIVEYFRNRGMNFEAVYDEGGIITAPGVGGINSSLALVGTAEKGFLSLRIKVRGMGGHSSMPPASSSLVKVAEIIEKLNKHQMPLRLTPPIASFLDRVGGTMDFPSRMAIANQWLLRPVLLKIFAGNSATNALVRTTTAITMAKGSDADNVISSVGEVTVNFRLLPGDSVEDVIEHVHKICEGYDVTIEVITARETSDVSPDDTKSFDAIRAALAPLYPSSIVTSYITVAGTDAYKYQKVSGNVYRFMPVYLNDFEQNTMHNENEHISLENYSKMILFYRSLMAQ